MTYIKRINLLSSLRDSAIDREAKQIIKNIYDLEFKKLQRESAKYIAEEMHYLIRSNTLIIDKIFNDINLELLSSWSLITLLRTNLNIKSKLNNWDYVLTYTEKYLDQIGLDSKKELHGITLGN